MNSTIEQIINHSEENAPCEGVAMPLVEWLALGKEGAVLWGQFKTVTQLLAIASSSGFDLKTGFSRPNMEFGGALSGVLDEGKELTLYWDESPK